MGHGLAAVGTVGERPPSHSWHSTSSGPKNAGVVRRLVHAWRLGADMEYVCTAICMAVRKGLVQRPELYGRLRLHFIGSDYAEGQLGRSTIAPLAAKAGIDGQIDEHPRRVPYFTALRLQQEADFLVALGSMDPAYTASKIYPLILSRRPLIAIFHEASGVVHVLRSTRAGKVITFRMAEDPDELSERLFYAWTALLEKLPFTPSVNWEAFDAYSAREMTRRQCAFFDRMVSLSPCPPPAASAHTDSAGP